MKPGRNFPFGLFERKADTPRGAASVEGPLASVGSAEPAPEATVREALRAADFLKALAHEGRLLMLAYLAQRERSVTELEALVQQRQSAVSQQLARLRHEKLVTARREGNQIIYALADERVRQVLELLGRMFLLPCVAPVAAASDATDTSPLWRDDCREWEAWQSATAEAATAEAAEPTAGPVAYGFEQQTALREAMPHAETSRDGDAERELAAARPAP